MKKDREKPEKNLKDKRLENLRPPFSKDNQPKKNGRPKGSLNFKTIVDKLDKNAIEKVIQRLIQEGVNEGNIQAIKEILERYLGKVPNVNLNENTNHELKIEVQSDKDKKVIEDL